MSDDELDELPVIGTCARCSRDVCDGDGYEHEDTMLCLSCAVEAAEDTAPTYREWAREHVKLTRKPHRYDPSQRFAPTPDEYTAGFHEAYTENSVLAYNRHNCTNYDELIRNLDPDDPWDSVRYESIRERAEELVGCRRNDRAGKPVGVMRLPGT